MGPIGRFERLPYTRAVVAITYRGEAHIFELIQCGGTQIALLATVSIDLSKAPYIACGEYQCESRLDDGTALYVPEGFKPFAATPASNRNPIETLLLQLCHPDYLIALLHPRDLQGCSNPTVQLLLSAAECGADLFVAAPEGMRVPRPLRWVSALEFDDRLTGEIDTALRGLLVFHSQHVIPNVRIKEVVALFSQGTRVSIGYAQHRDPCAAVRTAMRRSSDETSATKSVLVLETPQPGVPSEALGLLGPAFEGHWVCGYNEKLDETRAWHYAV